MIERARRDRTHVDKKREDKRAPKLEESEFPGPDALSWINDGFGKTWNKCPDRVCGIHIRLAGSEMHPGTADCSLPGCMRFSHKR